MSSQLWVQLRLVTIYRLLSSLIVLVMAAAKYVTYRTVLKMTRSQLLQRLAGAVARGAMKQTTMDGLMAGSRMKMVSAVFNSQRYMSRRGVGYVNTASTMSGRLCSSAINPADMTGELAELLKPIVEQAVNAAMKDWRQKASAKEQLSKRARAKEKLWKKKHDKLAYEIKALRRMQQRKHDLYLYYLRKERELREDADERLLYRLPAIMRDNLCRLGDGAGVPFKPKVPIRRGNYVLPVKNKLKRKYRLG